jgi:hypothetical protein
MWQKLKLKKPNIAIEMILEPGVAIVIETHSKVDTVATEVDNQMVIIQVQVGKNIIEIFFRWRSKCKYHNKKP